MEQLVTEYVWLWGALLLMAILYTIMFAVMRGWFIVENGVWYWYQNYQPTFEAVEETQEEQESRAIANLLLLYPVVYFICIIPLSIARWLFFSGYHVKYQGTLFTHTLFCLSGMFNATLFFFTRPELVVGSADSPPPAPAVGIHLQVLRDDGLTSPRSWQAESLPSRSPVAPYSSQFHPSMLFADGTNGDIRASPRQIDSNSLEESGGQLPARAAL